MKRLKDLITIFPKSDIQANNNDSGEVPFYTSSKVLNKWRSEAQFPPNSISMGTGGIASINYSSVEFSTSTDCFNFYVKDNPILTKYIYYYFFSILDMINFADFQGAGLRHLQKDRLLSYLIKDELSSKELILFLDNKCKEIDSLIEIENKQIEKLKEYKQAIIDNVFSKCKKIKLKYLTDGITDGTHGTFLRKNDGPFLLSAKNLGDYGLIISSNESSISIDDYNSIIKNGFPRKNDILMCCVGDVGKVLIYDYDEIFAFQRSVMFIRPSHKILPKFLLYGLRTSDVKIQEKKLSNKTIQSGLYQGLVKELFIPYSESDYQQNNIVDSIENILNYIELLICLKIKKNSLLEDYKKSIIYEYVTGKKELTND